MNPRAFRELLNCKVAHPEKGLTFSPPNTKLKKLAKKLKMKVRSFDLLAGYSCPFALKCRACAVPVNGTRVVKDSKTAEFRCYSASQEAIYPETFAMRYRNLKILRDCNNSTQKICEMLLKKFPIGPVALRLHVSGDFFSRAYYRAWCEVGWKLIEEQRPVTIYGYTKALAYLYVEPPPPNMRFTLSRGGTQDGMISYLKRRGFHECVVVHSEEEAAERGLPLECGDDTMAYNAEQDFAIVVHGMQPARK